MNLNIPNKGIGKTYFLENCPLCGSGSLKKCIETKVQMSSDNELYKFDICIDCELVMLNPRVPHNKLNDFYNASYLPYRGETAWGRYAKRVRNSLKMMDQKRMAKAKAILEITNKTKVWDVGCGRPSFLKLLHEDTKAQCTGIDFSDHGWTGRDSAYQNIKLVVGQLSDMDGYASPDLVTMWHYLEHDYDPLNTLTQIRGLSHSNTKLMIEIPNYNSEGRRKFGEYWAGYHTPRHTFLFSPDNIRKLLYTTGWSVIDLHVPATLDSYNLHWMSKMEELGLDWTNSMESEFFNYVKGFIKYHLLRKLGIIKADDVMLITAKAM